MVILCQTQYKTPSHLIRQQLYVMDINPILLLSKLRPRKLNICLSIYCAPPACPIQYMKI